MADSSDVENALVALIVAALYPNGTGAPSAIAGTPTISVERGWPTEADLRTATASGLQLIRVHAVPGMSRNADRYERAWIAPPPATPTVTATFAANVLTIGGTVTAGEIISIISLGQSYSYTTLANDTLNTIATALAGLVTGTSATGATVTFPTTGTIPSASVGVPTVATMEIGRQRQVFSASVWATTVALRDDLFIALMPAVAQNLRILLPDGTYAAYKGIQTGGPNDLPARAGAWARDLRVNFEYAIQLSMTGQPSMGLQMTLAPPVASAPTLSSVTN